MSQTEDSFSHSSVECDSVVDSYLEENFNVKSCFEPYQGEPLPTTNENDSSEDEEDEDGVLPSILVEGKIVVGVRVATVLIKTLLVPVNIAAAKR